MPLDAAGASTPQDFCDAIATILEKAEAFLPRGQDEALIRKFIPRADAARVTEEQLVIMAADASQLIGDLLLSQPTMTGSTALDRLARAYRPASPAEDAALSALRASKYRLLILQSSKPRGKATLRDALSGAAVQVAGAQLPPLPSGTPLFARLAKLDAETWCFAGTITPLDPAAFAFASTHPSATHPAASASAR